MHIFYLKSLLSLLVLLSAFIAAFTMFEIFGRAEKKFNIETLKKIHRANGFFFLLLFFVIAYFCLDFLVKTRTELSARAAFHGVFALIVIVIVIVKILFVTVYRQFYAKLQTAGFILLFMTMGMIGTSGGYYLLVTKLGMEMPVPKAAEERKGGVQGKAGSVVRTDPANIAKGRELYESKCYACHDPNGYEKVVGPGHKRILKNPSLPASGKPATPENVVNQLHSPYRDMPSFSYLSDEEIQDILAFLNTL
jgi:mono/diheme cytochrome c family protein